jgi:hypothetical protein
VDTLTVSLQEDHLESIIRNPVDGVTELIWNALDAEADQVTVTIERNLLGGVIEVRVLDDGHGMTPDEAREQFAQLGGSWKRSADRSRTKARTLHGKAGQGRWRAFGIGGERVRWETVAEVDGQRVLTTLSINRHDLRRVHVSDSTPTDRPIGTVAIIDGIADQPHGLLREKTIEKLTVVFALHLIKYPVSITYNDRRLDPESIQERRVDLPLEMDQSYEDPILTVIEWKVEVDRYLFLCDAEGVALHEVKPGVQSAGLSYTAYLRTPLIRKMENELALAEMDHQTLGPLLEAARDKLREHFRDRQNEMSRRVIDQWKHEEVYPYPEETTDLVEGAKRELFDLVAVTAANVLNAGNDQGAKKLSLRLLAEAVETRPSSLRRVLTDVVKLSDDQLEVFDRLLDRSPLESIISSAAIIADRLDFLEALEILVFDSKVKAKILERSQLHPLIAGATWLFGEEFAVAASDSSLNRVLKEHIAMLGREELAPEEEMGEDGRRRIDLLLGRATSPEANRREHLVVELKRPSIVIGREQLAQIEDYANAVSSHPRFEKSEVQWDFWIVGAELDEYVERRSHQRDRVPGLVYESDEGRVRIWAMTWGVLIENARHRLKFVRDQLGYVADEESALDYLKRAHSLMVMDEPIEGDQGQGPDGARVQSA